MKIVAIVQRTATVDCVLAVVTPFLSREGQHSVVVLHPAYEQDPSYLPTEEMPTAERLEPYRRQRRLRCALLKARFEIWRESLVVATPICWRELLGHPARTVPAQVEDADVIIIGTPVDDLHRDIAHAFRGLRLSNGRFIVLVPQTGERAPFPAAISIVWDEDWSVEQLIAAALPLTRQNAMVALHLRPGRPPATTTLSMVERRGSDTLLSLELVPAAHEIGSWSSVLYAQKRSYRAAGLAVLESGPLTLPDAGSGTGSWSGSIHALVFRRSPAEPSWMRLLRMPFGRKRVEAVGNETNGGAGRRPSPVPVISSIGPRGSPLPRDAT